VGSDEVLNFVEGPCYHDTISSIGVLARLANPDVSVVLFVFLVLMNLPSLQKPLILWIVESL
jgi:hypothetical protein